MEYSSIAACFSAHLVLWSAKHTKSSTLNKKSKVHVRLVYAWINSVIVPSTDGYKTSDPSDTVSPFISPDIPSSTQDTPDENSSGRLAAVAAGGLVVTRLEGTGDDADKDADTDENEAPAVLPCVICCIICAKCRPLSHRACFKISSLRPWISPRNAVISPSNCLFFCASS